MGFSSLISCIRQTIEEIFFYYFWCVSRRSEAILAKRRSTALLLQNGELSYHIHAAKRGTVRHI
jgi:hypothetical protein